MAKKNISNNETSRKAVSNKVVAKNKNNAKQKTQTVVKKAPEVSLHKQEVSNEMDNFMSEENVSPMAIVRKVWNIVFWILFAIIACVWIVDFFRVKAEQKPIFCVRKETIKFDDGTVDKCTGLGYIVYNYNRKSLDKGIEFGSFLIKMKEPETK